jgi:hypothetical protein
VNWGTSAVQSWLSVEPNTGVIDANNSVDVNVCISTEANLLDPNIYTEILTFENLDSGGIKPRPVTLTVKPPDCFTESFRHDLDFLSLTVSPDGSNAYYEACRDRVEEFPTDPNGGTPVSLGDDDFAEVVLSNDANVLFYGTRYDRFYVGSNGYITFAQGDSNSAASLENHFALRRISALFTDLDPSSSGSVSYKQVDDSVVVTFDDVPLNGDANATNSFQIEMFFVDGSICVSWLKLAATSGVAGLSKGRGLPPVYFVESDLTEYLPCCPWGDFSKDYAVSFVDYAVLAAHFLDENCGIPYWCEKTDLDFSGSTDGVDLGVFTEDWLVTDQWWLEPAAYWTFDEGEGDTVYDQSWFNHGAVYGAAWTSGKIGGALSFDGVDNYVDVGDNAGLDFGMDDFTVSVWIKTSMSGAGFIVNKRAKGMLPGYDLYIQDGKLYARISDSSSAGDARTTDTFNDGEWYHLAAVYDRDDVVLQPSMIETMW